MDPNYLFRSERLGFRNWTADDVPKMTAISANPEVMQFFPAPATPQQTQDFVISGIPN
ncbi:GNAT family N-acetyltransferase [Salinimicrobium soli]|uniref:GNAT family N-acetyltransferase n=1 Tax=Salinimicrobium soli TaxID=1254399 RepID=UPI003AAF810B